MFKYARKRQAQAEAKAKKQLQAQKDSLARKTARRRANGCYSAMELVALESRTGSHYYSTPRVTGERFSDTTDWRDHYNASK